MLLSSKVGGSFESETAFVDRMRTIGLYKDSEDNFDSSIGKISFGKKEMEVTYMT